VTTAKPAIELKDSQLSAIYQTADQVSGTGQRTTKRLVRTELIALIVASGAGVTAIRVTSYELDVLAPISAIAFIVALVCTFRRSQTKPEEDWYEGRAGAESARTLAWKYAIGAKPFPVGGDEEEEKKLTKLFLDRLRNIVKYLEDTKLPTPNSEVRELTEAMKRVRASDLATRRLVYQRDRIKDQLDWYARRSNDHDKSAKWWLGAAITASAAGIVMAVLKFFLIDIDLLGVFAAVASSAIAWNQLNQHRNQATAYTVTARELNIIHDQIEHVPDDEWAAFAEGAEDAISREHTMWAARRGYGTPSS
jgi:SMODS and SLOG-associating 2TM effector domain 3/SMODS and SLOG-associating 2TM effector domain 1